MLVVAGIDDPKLDSTTSHPSSSSHSLPRRVVCHPGHSVSTIMGGLVMASVRMLRLLPLSLSVGLQSVSVSATVTAVSKPVVSVTAIIRRHFRLRPKPEKKWFRSVSIQVGTNDCQNQVLPNIGATCRI